MQTHCGKKENRMEERREGSEKGALRWSDSGKGELLMLNATYKQNKVNEMRLADVCF